MKTISLRVLSSSTRTSLSLPLSLSPSFPLFLFLCRILSAMLPFLVHIVIISHSAVLVEPVEVSPHGDLLDLPWQTGLCCSSTPAQLYHGGEEEDRGSAPSDTGHPHTLQCLFRNFTSTLGPHPETEPSRATCWDILCRVDETWDNVICDLKHPATSSDTSIPGSVALSLQHLTTLPNIEVNSTHGTDCVGEDSITCSIALHVVSSIVVVTANVSNTTAGPLVMLSVPPRTSQRLWKPSPPLNLTHTQTTEGELILSWSDPQPHASPVQLSYEVRYNTSQSTSHPNWLHVDVSGAQWLSLTGLRPGLQYTLQIRSHHPALPHLWSDWSQQYRIRLENVTYLPERVVASFGDSVTVYCVCNDLRVNASTVVWILNSRDRLPKSQYTAVNDRVSKITVRPSEQRLSDTLHCCQPFGETYSCNYHYSTIYIKDPVIDISCVTSGDLDSMTCRWNNLPIGGINFMSRVADLSCDVMEEAERVGVPVGVVRQAKCESSGYRGVKSCNLQPIRVTSCYKLWMEAKTDNSTRSHPVYITPMDHVKPHPPSGLEAVSMPSGVLKLAWVPPELPIYDMQYQVRYALSTGRAHPFWQVLALQTESWAEVLEPDVCGVYNVQVRCMHINGSGTWSDWSHLLYTSTHNSRAPDQGPDFWRVFQEDPASTQTNVTLLFEHSPIVEPTYCVEELVVQHQGSGGTVTEERIGLVSSYSFEWRGEVHSVTVKAQNSQGSSTRNTHMTLDRHPKRQCVRSFSASRVNSSCVVLLWSLQPNSSVPWSLVVEWSGQNHQDRPDQTPESRERWTRFPPTDKLLYLYGHFYDTDEYEFILYPVFADGEGEPVYTKVFRGSDAGPAAYMLLMIIAFLSIVLFVTLVISQNHMKKFMWKDVPNPNNCSWAQGIDFGKADTMEQLFRHPEGLPAWPLLLVSETISQATIMEKTGPPTSGSDKDLIPASSPALCVDSEVPGLPEEEEESLQLPDLPRSLESSAQPSVTYATVLLSDNPHHLYKQEGSLSSSSDEGNFSGNNSDISGSFPGGLWELEISHSGVGESDLDPRRSCSYNSVEEFSETSEQEDEALGGERDGGIEVIKEKDLYYLGMDCQEESEEEEEEEDTRAMLFKEVMVLGRGGSSVESIPLLGSQDSMFSEYSDEGSVVGMRSVPLYLPQFRTAPSSPLKAQDSAHQL